LKIQKRCKANSISGHHTENLFAVIDDLANGNSLDERIHDHCAEGVYKGSRDCLIEPDWLLIYAIAGDHFTPYPHGVTRGSFPVSKKHLRNQGKASIFVLK